MIKRAFADLPFGQIHYRHGGAGAPLLLLHASPGSAKQLVPLLTSMAPLARVIAPDTAGFGDSAPLPETAPEILDYARILPDFLDQLGLDQVDVYGSHTGACIAAELAILAPTRVRRVILDGVGVFTPEQRDDLLAHYAHPFTPDHDGAYLLRAFMFLRDAYLFFPWYARSRAARRDAGLRPAHDLHEWLVEVLKAPETYHLGYRAAFRWDVARMALITQPVLLTAPLDDPLHDGMLAEAGSLQQGRFESLPSAADPDFAARRAARFAAFLA